MQQNYRAEIKPAGAGFHALANYRMQVDYPTPCYRTCIHSNSYARLFVASVSPHTGDGTQRGLVHLAALFATLRLYAKSLVSEKLLPLCVLSAITSVDIFSGAVPLRSIDPLLCTALLLPSACSVRPFTCTLS